jgi:recombinational DNA repair protein RecR
MREPASPGMRDGINALHDKRFGAVPFKSSATIESIRDFRGRCHVLMGAISPIDGVGPGNLRIASLIERVHRGGDLEFADRQTLSRSFKGRTQLQG